MAARQVDVAHPTTALTGMDFLRDESFELDRLAGGLTNRNYRVTAGSGEQFVARFSGAKSDLLAIDRNAEAANSRIAAELGVGPEVVAFAPERHTLVVRWIEGRTLTDTALADSAMLARVAATCRRLHAGPRFVGDFDMFDIQRRYLDIVQRHGFRLPADYLDFAPELRAADDLLHASSRGTVACHNDLLAANIMDDGERIWFIDFEYAGNNDPCFELGNLWSEANLSTDYLDDLVSSYFGRPSPVQTARARLFAVVAKYGWTLWASIQDAVSDVDFDFWQWGMEKYTRATAEFRSSAFDDLITIVRDDIKGA